MNKNDDDNTNNKNRNSSDENITGKKLAPASELKDLLRPLREVQPNAVQMQQWKFAANAANNAILPRDQRSGEDNESRRKSTMARKDPTSTRWLPLQLVAALLVGFILGALLFKSNNESAPEMEWAKNIEADATFERVHTNLD